MMKRAIFLAVIVPALLVAGTANLQKSITKDGKQSRICTVKLLICIIFPKGNGENSYGGNGDMTLCPSWF